MVERCKPVRLKELRQPTEVLRVEPLFKALKRISYFTPQATQCILAAAELSGRVAHRLFNYLVRDSLSSRGPEVDSARIVAGGNRFQKRLCEGDAGSLHFPEDIMSHWRMEQVLRAED